MSRSPRCILAVVVFCHFLASFAALGVPPFFGLILSRSLHSEADYLVGWLYVAPTLCLALSSPHWGRLADRLGRKKLLLRAQLGLALSFALAGFATDLAQFVFALLLQGLVGGTFSASNAYLAGQLEGSALARGLTVMQGSARAALVAAPVVIGSLGVLDSPIEIYRYLALLPLLAALLLLGLPESTGAPTPAAARKTGGGEAVRPLLALQFAFTFATIVTFPYFIPFVLERFGAYALASAGMLFALPHLVYLLCALPLSRSALASRSWLLGGGFAALALALLLQSRGETLPLLSAGRLLMGAAMTLCFIGLHEKMARLSRRRDAGRDFGGFEASAKWATLCAGLAAGAVYWLNPASPFWLGAAVALFTCVWLVIASRFRLSAAQP